MLKTAPPFNTNANPRVSSLALAALGIVFGDIGTSPLYALRECFNPDHCVAVNEANVLGILSLIVWALFLVVTVKYIVFVLRADNEGEGGILALMALAQRHGGPARSVVWSPIGWDPRRNCHDSSVHEEGTLFQSRCCYLASSGIRTLIAPARSPSFAPSLG